MKRILLLVCVVLLLSVPTAFAEPPTEELKVDIDSIYEQVTNLINNGATDEEINQYKLENGISNDGKETIRLDANGNVINDKGISIFATEPIAYTLTVWHDRNDRALTTNYIFVNLSTQTIAAYEQYPATYDVLSINWDSSVFDFVSTSTSGGLWLSDASKSLNGTVLFSVRDNDSVGTTQSAWATLSTRSGKRGILSSANTQYTHTYDTTKKTTTNSGNATINWQGQLTVGFSYSVVTNTVEANWSKAATTSFYTP